MFKEISPLKALTHYFHSVFKFPFAFQTKVYELGSEYEIEQNKSPEYNSISS
jgi:hypothetical protein